MRSLRTLTAVCVAALALAACDVIRYPGDGGPEPETPDAGPAVPPGAPGPPPPTTPVDDPYDTGDADNSDSADTPVADAPDTSSDSDAGDAPDTDADTPDNTPADDTPLANDDPATDTDTPDDTPDTTDATDPADTTDTTDTTDTVPDDTDVADTDTDVVVTPDPEPEPEPEPVFSYYAPGALIPGTGEGNVDDVVYAPDMVFPIATAPTWLQSQVFTFGGGVGGGDQCDPRNYQYPWRDNFCETRSANRNSPYCPSNKIHQGQDIRVGTPEGCNEMRGLSAADRTLYEVVAVEDGIISNIGSYSVNLRAGGRIYKYLHLNMAKLKVKTGDSIKAGDPIGYVSNDFGGYATTFHLHFEITQNTGDAGWVHVPPYLSLVEAFERRENGPGEEVSATNIGVASAPVVIPEGFIITE